LRLSLERGASVIGGGSAPEVKLATILVAIQADDLSVTTIETQLRNYRIPIIARTERDRVLIDLRTVADDEEEIIIESLLGLAQLSQPSAASVEA
jgi:L-seryl-tRNA(Ser) seleniumtransferase